MSEADEDFRDSDAPYVDDKGCLHNVRIGGHPLRISQEMLERLAYDDSYDAYEGYPIETPCPSPVVKKSEPPDPMQPVRKMLFERKTLGDDSPPSFDMSAMDDSFLPGEAERPKSAMRRFLTRVLRR